MKRISLLVALLGLVAAQAHAGIAPRYYQAVPKPVYPPGPCIQCGIKVIPNYGDPVTVNPKTSLPSYKTPSIAR